MQEPEGSLLLSLQLGRLLPKYDRYEFHVHGLALSKSTIDECSYMKVHLHRTKKSFVFQLCITACIQTDGIPRRLKATSRYGSKSCVRSSFASTVYTSTNIFVPPLSMTGNSRGKQVEHHSCTYGGNAKQCPKS